MRHIFNSQINVHERYKEIVLTEFRGGRLTPSFFYMECKMPKQEESSGDLKPIPMIKWSDIRTLESMSKLLEEHGMIYIIDPSNGIPIKVTRAGLH